jgi:hypothetical protein
MSFPIRRAVIYNTPQQFPEPLQRLPYDRTSDAALIDGNRMDARSWTFDDYMTVPNEPASSRKIDFYQVFPEMLGFDEFDRETLIQVNKEFIRTLRCDLTLTWGHILADTQVHFRSLGRFMAKRGCNRIGDLTPEAAHAFLSFPRVMSVAFTRGRKKFLERIHIFFMKGILPDGLIFNPAEYKPEKQVLPNAGIATSANDNCDDEDDEEEIEEQQNLRNETMPLKEEVFLTTLASAITFIRFVKPKLLEAVSDLAENRPVDMAPFRQYPILRRLHNQGLDQMLLYFQKAVYIVIASSLIGRSNEYLEMGRLKDCYKPGEVDGEPCYNFEISWSKRKDHQRPIVEGRGNALTLEAITALDAIVAAHPATRDSHYLFCRFPKAKRDGVAAGLPVGRAGHNKGMKTFLRNIVGLSQKEADEIHSHRFRSSAIVNLCCVPDGVIAAWIEARHTSLKDLCDYALAATKWLGIEANLDAITGSK